MPEYTLTKKEARQFLLCKQGLLGKYKFEEKTGVLDFIRQAGCIQFDPIDVCGKSPEILLHSRVKHFSKSMFYELLYMDRDLVDYFDKQLSIFLTEDWPFFARERKRHRQWERSHEKILKVRDTIREAIRSYGPLNSGDLDLSEKVYWYWSDTRLSRAALEHMYFGGELAIHHKKGTIKYYDLVENCIPHHLLNQPDPHQSDFEYYTWQVLRRVGSVGLLWNRSSDAWLGILGLKTKERNDSFARLLSQGSIVPVQVEGIPHTLYCRTEDTELLEYIKTKPRLTKRCEFLAPLDNMLWDRKLIKAIFDFEYKWEIYTPKEQRRYGYYVLPILYGDRFIGRIETVYNKKQKSLNTINIWYELEIKQTATVERQVEAAIIRFEKFHQRL